MPTHGEEVVIPLRHVIVTCRLLYGSSWAVIEQKTGVLANTALRIVQRAINQAGNKDFNDVLACVADAEGRGSEARIPDDSKLSSDVRNAMLKHSHTSSVKAVLNKKNIVIPEARKRRRCIFISNT